MNKLKIHFLNTIWSDAIVLEKNNRFAMVDTASPFYYPMVKEHLNSNNAKVLEFIFLTHFHIDHYGNIKNIINDYKVKTLYMKHYHGLDGTTSSGYASNEEYIENEFKNYYEIIEACEQNGTNIIYIDEHQDDELLINFEGTFLDVYNFNNLLYELYSTPSSNFYMQKRFNENFNCAGIFIKENSYNIFLGGDVTCSISDKPEVKALSYKMIQKIYQKYNINHIDLYKSCHHGGGGTNTLDLCKLIKPRFTIITNTARWLDNWDTYKNLKEGYEDVVILPTDHQKYLFTIDNKISYHEIKDESLFLILNKD